MTNRIEEIQPMEGHTHIFGNTYFSHGDNLLGKHVDCIYEMNGETTFKFVREANLDELYEYCKPSLPEKKPRADSL